MNIHDKLQLLVDVQIEYQAKNGNRTVEFLNSREFKFK